MAKIIRLTESDLTRIVRRVIKESNEMGKIKEFKELFSPLGVMWIQNENDSTAYMPQEGESNTGGRLSFTRKGKNITCKLKRDGVTIQCQDGDKIMKFNLDTELDKVRKWMSNYQR